MNKEAIAAKALLGMIAGGAALTGGGAAVGHRFGVKAGAESMGNQMASAFSEANAKENKTIVDSFKAFNKRENAVIANKYLRKGINVGYNMAAEKTDNGVKKTASDIADEAFYDEIEKLGFPLSAIGGFARRAAGSFSRLGSGLGGSAKQLGKAIVTKGAKRKSYISNSLSMAQKAVKGSPKAVATIGGAGIFSSGYALGKPNPKRTIVEHRY